MVDRCEFRLYALNTFANNSIKNNNLDAGRIGSKTGRFPRNYCDDQEIEKALENPVPIIMKVRHTFSARNKGELSMSKGDMITVVEIHNSGWWIGTIGEKKGRFPSNYCEFVDLAESS